MNTARYFKGSLLFAEKLSAYLTDTTRGAVYDSLMGVLHEQICEDKFGHFAPPLVKERDNSQMPHTGAPSVTLEVQPNPTDGTSLFQWQTNIDGTVKITIIDRLGRLVATAFQGFSKAGVHSAIFETNELSNGVYYARLEAEGQTFVTQIGVLR